MALTLLKLKLELFRATVRSSRAATWGVIITYALAAYLVGVALLRIVQSEQTLGVSSGLEGNRIRYGLVYFVVMLLVAGVDLLVTPFPTRWLRQFGATPRKVFLAQTLYYLWSFPGLALLVGTITVSVASIDQVRLPTLMLGGILAFLLGAELLMTLGLGLSAAQVRLRPVLLTLFLLLVLNALLALLFTHFSSQPNDPNTFLTHFLALSPLGAPWATMFGPVSWATMAASVAWVLVLGLTAGYFTHISYKEDSRKAEVESRLQRHLPDVLFSTKTSTVAVGSVAHTYKTGWYWSNLAASFLLPLLIAGAYAMSFGGSAFGIGLLYAASFFIGFSGYNSLGIVGPAVWPHAASRIPGWADRLGTAVPLLAAGIGVDVLASTVLSLIYQDVSFAAALIISFVCLLFGLSVATLLSVLMPFSVGPRASRSIFREMVSGLAGSALGIAFLIIVLVVFHSSQEPAALLLFLVTSIGIFAGTIAFSGKLLEKRFSRIISSLK